jgi:hypothetical protein
MSAVRFPDNRRFAFTILDDTDHSTVENVGPVYEVLARLGFRTTKTVWPLAPRREFRIGGSTLEDPAYRDFVLDLRGRGFEIAFHGALCHSATREETEEGLHRFREVIGYYPRVHANHHNNAENIYWGAARLSTAGPRLLYRLATMRRSQSFEGERRESPHFWGDLCHRHVRYVRNFVFRRLNLLHVNLTLPYHDPDRPYVPFWFSSSEAPDLGRFCEALQPERQDRLEAEGGVAILYTHFANGFVTGGKPDAGFCRLLERLASRPGWFVPVGDLLDHLRQQQGDRVIPRHERAAMERRWIWEKLRHGTS